MSFFDLDLASPLVHAVHALGVSEPSAIQAQAIPVILDGDDLIGCAPTGSGKTLAYLLPLLQHWQRESSRRPHTGFVRELSTLIVVPTRELALQVHDTLCDLLQGLRADLRARVVYGGVSINPQMMQLRGSADFLVATPGRLLDLLDHNAVRLQHVRHLVLDEADRLLDPGFADEMDELLDALPARRQTLLFSATLAPHVQSFAEREMADPACIRVDASPDAATADHAGSPERIVQRAVAVDASRRTQLLRQLIEQQGALLPPMAAPPASDTRDGHDAQAPADPAAGTETEAVFDDWSRVLVFVAKRHTAEVVADKLYKYGIKATTFHGELSQGARNAVLTEFKEKRWQVLITTDLAARGIDIARLPVVVNYDLPRSPADHVHRVGRTGRAGRAGLAITFVTPADTAHWALVQKRNGLRLAPEVLAGYETTEPVPPAPAVGDGNGGIKGRRLSKKDKLRMAQAQKPLSP